MEAFDQAIFFDNEEINISGTAGVCVTCEHVQCIKVNHTVPKPNTPWEEISIKEYLTLIGSNTYVDILKNYFDTSTYDKLSGIQEREIVIFRKWNADTAHVPKRAAIFDWDRTITVMEGSLPANDPATMSRLRSEKEALRDLPDAILKDMLVYLLGGEVRLKMLRELFRECVESRIQIIIITNTGSCELAAFDVLLTELFSGIPFTKICSKLRTSKLRGKGDYLQEFFSKTKYGGKRKYKKRSSTRKNQLNTGIGIR